MAVLTMMARVSLWAPLLAQRRKLQLLATLLVAVRRLVARRRRDYR